MAKIHGIPGEWARVKGTVAGLWPLFLGVFAFGFSVALAISFPLVGFSLSVASLVFVLVSLLRGLRHVERFFKGARGEEKVSGILTELPDSYHVFNDFVAGRDHIDHVAIGPSGVFAIETKFWAGRVTVEEGHILLDGRLPSREPLVQVLREAASVRSELDRLGWKGKITPVLVFASDTFAHHVAEMNGVVVINACELSSAFATRRQVLSPDELIRIVTLMENNQR